MKIVSNDKAKLKAALSAALLVAKNAQSVEEGLLFQTVALRDSPESAPMEFRELLTVVRSISALEIFNHAYQCGLGGWEKVEYPFLVGWLVSRGQKVGAEEAVENLDRYLEADTLDLTEVLAVDGFVLASSVTLGDFQIVPWGSVAPSDTKWRVTARALHNHVSPTAAVLRCHTIQREHVRPWGSSAANSPVPIEPAFDVLRCVTVVTGAGIRPLHRWFEPPEWAPWAVNLSRFGLDATSFAPFVDVDGELASRIKHCISRFEASDESVRMRLRLPIDRLNRSYLAGSHSINKAIELGVALESLFAPAKLSEGIAFAVRTRAARFLGGTLENRRITAFTLKDVYDLRSRAVHSGRFDADDSSKKWRDSNRVMQVLQEGQRVVSRSLLKVIVEGEPVWADFDIGNDDGGVA